VKHGFLEIMHGKSYHTSTIATAASSSFICLLKCASSHYYLKNAKSSMFTPKDCAQAPLWICDELLQLTARIYLLFTLLWSQKQIWMILIP